MAISLKHAKQSAKSDSSDSSIIQPSDWNAEHVLEMATSRLLGRVSSGDGAAEELSKASALSFLGLTTVATNAVLASSTFANDNRLLRSDGTSRGAQASSITVDDSGNISNVNSLAGLSELTLAGVNGIDINPGSDIDADLITVGVTGTPTLSWDESSDAFRLNSHLVLDAATGGDVTHTIAGTSVVSQIELHSEGSDELGGLTVHRHSNANNFGGHAIFLRSQGTHASPTIVADNNILGRIIGAGYDGTDYELAAEIRFRVDGTPGSDDMPGDIGFFVNAGSQTLTERLTLRADGRVEVIAGPLAPSSNDGAALGSASLQWSDLFLASGGVLNFANGDVTITHATNTLTLGGSGVAFNFADLTLQRPKIMDYGETVNAVGSIGGGMQDIDLESGNVVTATVDTSETTFTFSNPPASGTAGSFTLILTNGGSQTVNWPASVDWAGGTAPTLTTSGVDVLTFVTTDGGTTWYGFPAGLDMS